jgi:hypothetical protein
MRDRGQVRRQTRLCRWVMGHGCEQVSRARTEVRLDNGRVEGMVHNKTHRCPVELAHFAARRRRKRIRPVQMSTTELHSCQPELRRPTLKKSCARGLRDVVGNKRRKQMIHKFGLVADDRPPTPLRPWWLSTLARASELPSPSSSSSAMEDAAAHVWKICLRVLRG